MTDTGQPSGGVEGRSVTGGELGLAALCRPPRRRTTTRLLAVAFGLSAICWYLGADVWHSILFGGSLTTLGVIGSGDIASPQNGFVEWRDVARRDGAGTRSDVAVLSRSLRGSRGRVSDAAVWRVTQIAQRRLSSVGLDLDDPAHRGRIEELIGRRAYAVLRRRQRRPPRLRGLLDALDALDALGALNSTRPTTPSTPQHRAPSGPTDPRGRARAR